MNFPQHQAVRRRGHSRLRTVARFQNIANIARLEFAGSDLDQCPDDSAAILLQSYLDGLA